jgi:hypothetical protein
MARRRLFVSLLLAGALPAAAGEPAGVPPQYAGNWVCQTFTPGYSIVPPPADPSQPMTNKQTTPSTVAVLKVSIRTDGTYDAPNAKGRYAFDPETGAVTWLDGLHHRTLSKTRIGKRENGAPKMGFVLNKRYYGCYLSKP